MDKKKRLTVVLLLIAVISFCIIKFVIIPYNNKLNDEYKLNQNDALTHDITAVEKYKSKYIGDNSNVTNLFYHLPLNSVSMKFQINADNGSLTVTYLDTVRNIGVEKVHRDLTYNSIAAMALIDNLSEITYEFSGDTFTFTREQIGRIVGYNLHDLLINHWKEKVQTQLNSADFVNSFYN